MSSNAKVFLNPEELFAHLLALAKDNAIVKSGPIEISSYNMYLGITGGYDWNDQYPSTVRAFIEYIRHLEHRILIGVPYFVECKPDCKECRQSYNKILERYALTKDHLELTMHFIASHHLKYYRIGNHGFTGGINLSPSGYTDVAVEVDFPTTVTLSDIFNQKWHGGNDNPMAYRK